MYSEWEEYLARVSALSTQGVALTLLWRTLAAAVPGLPIPAASVADSVADDRCAHMSWDRDEHHFDLDIEPDGYEWFYRNRVTQAMDGSDKIAFDCRPDDMLKRLRLILPAEQRT